MSARHLARMAAASLVTLTAAGAISVLGFATTSGANTTCSGTYTSGCTVTGMTVPGETYAAGTPFSSGQQINIVIPANSVLPSDTELDVVECASPGGVDPTDPSTCDGNTINPNSLQTNGDGSVNYDSYAGSYYQMFALPNAGLGESSDGQPVCNLTSECVLYIGTNNADFTQPHLWSNPYYVDPNGGSNAGLDPGDGTGAVPAPTIRSVAPSSGPTTGGTSVSIIGTNLSGATVVEFGTAAGVVTSDTATTIVATDPAGTAGTVKVAVTTSAGTASDASAFTYYVPGLLRVTTSPALASQITVDGNIADTWGLTWVKEWPRVPTPSASAPSRGTSPRPARAVTVTCRRYHDRHWQLRPAWLPAGDHVAGCAGGGHLHPVGRHPTPMDDWGAYTDLPVGTYSVCFGAVAGYEPPACQPASVAAGATTTITGAYTADSGATGQSGVGLLRATTSPALPSQISIDGNIADTWGLTWLEIAPGSHTVCFSAIQGYTAPGLPDGDGHLRGHHHGDRDLRPTRLPPGADQPGGGRDRLYQRCTG
jgi:hypothetical protein